uniref:6-Cys domain-containing protein n=1 Tax=Babesia bovis TaxID=5865 RepID=A0A0S3J4Q1_BABBO|nr:hypothetical protein [Babesia bovis]
MKRNIVHNTTLITAVVAFVLFHNATDGVYAAKGINDTITNAFRAVNEYVFEAKTIQYVKPEDFEPEDDILRVVDLYPGDSLKYSCGKEASSTMGTFMLHPSNPKTHILLPKGDEPVDVASNRVYPNHTIYRSDRELVISTFRSMGLDHLLIDYARDTKIVAKDNKNFSLNLLCIFIPSDVNGSAKFRWLQINFKNVLPIPYGCGSAGYHMFKNSIPIGPDTPHDKVLEAAQCEIEAEPNMILGIYCSKDDYVYPDDCFRQVIGMDGKRIMFNQFREYSFPHNLIDGNMRLMKLSPKAFNHDMSFSCQCRNKDDKITSIMKVNLRKTETCDFVQIMDIYRRYGNWPRKVCRKTLSTNKVIKIIIPKSDGIANHRNDAGGLLLYPENFGVVAYNPTTNMSHLREIRINRIIGYVGLKMNKIENINNYTFEFSTTENSVIVMKRRIASLSYLYEYYDRFSGPLTKKNTMITIDIVPTDPYTYGCGAENPDIFNTKGVVFNNQHIQKGAHYHTEVKCTLNAWKNSPIGFYCPKQYVLEPADCFNSAYLVSTNHVVRLDEYAPQGRVLNSPNLRIIDFTGPKSVKYTKKYLEESLQCRCRRRDGTVMATITIDLGRPRDK